MVERGDTIEITDRGRPVALRGPIPSGSPLEQLLLGGDIEPATGEFDDLPEPLPSTARRLPSQVLAACAPTSADGGDVPPLSAIVKLVVAEPESPSLRTSARTEVLGRCSERTNGA